MSAQMRVVAESPARLLSSHLSFLLLLLTHQVFGVLSLNTTRQQSHTQIPKQPTATPHNTTTSLTAIIPSASSAMLPDLYVWRFHCQSVCHSQVENRDLIGDYKNQSSGLREAKGANPLYKDRHKQPTLHVLHMHI